MSEGEAQLGEVLAERYELRDVIAEGAQGFLYRAKDRKDGDDVAVKVLRRASLDPEAVERLYREAHAMTQLRGTAAVRVLDLVTAPEGAVGLVMELLRGRELKDELLELEATGERLPADRIASLFAPIVKTLDAARDLGIVHRDVKAENVFVIHPAYGGGVRLLDFGFARFTRSRRITRDGMVAGSPSNLAPEVWLGKDDIDHRADVYGLAVVLYRVLGGQVPFKGANFIELMKAVTTAPRPSLRALRPDLPPAIDDWAEHALAVDRERRFQSATALWNALRGCLGV
jgi:eukaryotic-like serine/threonine-protein kinase